MSEQHGTEKGKPGQEVSRETTGHKLIQELAHQDPVHQGLRYQDAANQEHISQEPASEPADHETIEELVSEPTNQEPAQELAHQESSQEPVKEPDQEPDQEPVDDETTIKKPTQEPAYQKSASEPADHQATVQELVSEPADQEPAQKPVQEPVLKPADHVTTAQELISEPISQELAQEPVQELAQAPVQGLEPVSSIDQMGFDEWENEWENEGDSFNRAWDTEFALGLAGREFGQHTDFTLEEYGEMLLYRAHAAVVENQNDDFGMSLLNITDNEAPSPRPHCETAEGKPAPQSQYNTPAEELARTGLDERSGDEVVENEKEHEEEHEKEIKNDDKDSKAKSQEHPASNGTTAQDVDSQLSPKLDLELDHKLDPELDPELSPKQVRPLSPETYQEIILNLHEDHDFLQAVIDYNDLRNSDLTVHSLGLCLSPQPMQEDEQVIVNESLRAVHEARNISYQDLPPIAPDVGIWDRMVLFNLRVPAQYLYLQLSLPGVVFTFDK